jgi:ABC-2 type transport system permease protein
MSTATHVAARPAVALPSVTRVSLNRTVLKLKSFFRRREAVVFTFSLPVVLLIIFGSIFHGTVGTTGVSYRLYFTAGIIASGISRHVIGTLINWSLVAGGGHIVWFGLRYYATR